MTTDKTVPNDGKRSWL